LACGAGPPAALAPATPPAASAAALTHATTIAAHRAFLCCADVDIVPPSPPRSSKRAALSETNTGQLAGRRRQRRAAGPGLSGSVACEPGLRPSDRDRDTGLHQRQRAAGRAPAPRQNRVRFESCAAPCSRYPKVADGERMNSQGRTARSRQDHGDDGQMLSGWIAHVARSTLRGGMP
jgi:hypothetical protein